MILILHIRVVVCENIMLYLIITCVSGRVGVAV